jgi:acyl-CoA synthetase (AMP-forming)/AMP-acid ligase II
VIKERLGKVKVGSLGLLPDVPFNVKVLIEAGVVRPTRPDRLAGVLRELRRWGASPAAGVAASAIRYPDEPMIIDELGELTFSQVQKRSNRLARALRANGVKEGDGVAILARNHRGFIETVLAVSKIGANALFMNTMFSGPQLVDVVDREDPKAVVYDEEFLGIMEKVNVDIKRFVAWNQEGGTGDPSLEELIQGETDESNFDPPASS